MESLGVDIKLLIAQIINFALFFYIFRKFIAKPFSQFLNIELQKEKEKERILEEVRKKEEAVILQEKKAKEKIKKEYEEAVKTTKQEVGKIREELISAAKVEGEEIIARGRRQIGEEKEAMHKEMKEKIADLSLLIVRRALNQFLTPDIQKKITHHILRNFAKEII